MFFLWRPWSRKKDLDPLGIWLLRIRTFQQVSCGGESASSVWLANV